MLSRELRRAGEVFQFGHRPGIVANPGGELRVAEAFLQRRIEGGERRRQGARAGRAGVILEDVEQAATDMLPGEAVQPSRSPVAEPPQSARNDFPAPRRGRSVVPVNTPQIGELVPA